MISFNTGTKGYVFFLFMFISVFCHVSVRHPEESATAVRAPADTAAGPETDVTAPNPQVRVVSTHCSFINTTMLKTLQVKLTRWKL